MDVRGKHVVVLGLAASGRAAAALALARGAKVTGLDLREDVAPIEGVDMVLGPHPDEVLDAADVLVVSPGIPARIAPVRRCIDAGKVVVGELAFAWSFLEDPVTIAITGTNGKSTVTWFTGQILQKSKVACFVGGNLGRPLSRAVLEGEAPDVYVIEVSSYQLELPGEFHAQVATILNLSPDHLARHGDMDGYAAAKARVFDRQTSTDWGFLPPDDERLRGAVRTAGRLGFLGGRPGWTRDGRVVRVDLGQGVRELDLAGFAVPGEHNLDNAATAALLALAVGVPVSRVQEALPTLEPLAHRMEIVPTHDEILWINDSKGTNLDACRVGVAGLDRTAVVLLGGEAKAGSDFGELAPLLARHRAVVTFGGSGEMITEQLARAGVAVTRVGSMADAVATARLFALPGDAVLLSPGCASFDEFENFEHRGQMFRELVQETA